MKGGEEDLTKDDEKPGPVVKAEEFVEDGEGPVEDDEGRPVGVDVVVFGEGEMHGSVLLNLRQSSFSGQGNLTFRKS